MSIAAPISKITTWGIRHSCLVLCSDPTSPFLVASQCRANKVSATMCALTVCGSAITERLGKACAHVAVGRSGFPTGRVGILCDVLCAMLLW